MDEKMSKTLNSKPGDLIRSFNMKMDNHDYVRSICVSLDEKLIYVSFNWNKDIRVFNVPHNKEESKINKNPWKVMYMEFTQFSSISPTNSSSVDPLIIPLAFGLVSPGKEKGLSKDMGVQSPPWFYPKMSNFYFLWEVIIC